MSGNHLTEIERECLAVLIEECSEVIKAASKILRFGFKAEDVTGNARVYDNRAELEHEMGDVRATMILCGMNGIVAKSAVHAFADKKLLEMSSSTSSYLLYAKVTLAQEPKDATPSQPEA